MTNLDSLLGKNISAARRAAGLSETELARPLDMSDADLRAIECGARRVRANELYQMSKRLNLDIYRFFGNEESINIHADGPEPEKSESMDKCLKILDNLRLNRTLRDLRKWVNSAIDNPSGTNEAA